MTGTCFKEVWSVGSALGTFISSQARPFLCQHVRNLFAIFTSPWKRTPVMTGADSQVHDHRLCRECKGLFNCVLAGMSMPAALWAVARLCARLQIARKTLAASFPNLKLTPLTLPVLQVDCRGTKSCKSASALSRLKLSAIKTYLFGKPGGLSRWHHHT